MTLEQIINKNISDLQNIDFELKNNLRNYLFEFINLISDFSLEKNIVNIDFLKNGKDFYFTFKREKLFVFNLVDDGEQKSISTKDSDNYIADTSIHSIVSKILVKGYFLANIKHAFFWDNIDTLTRFNFNNGNYSIKKEHQNIFALIEFEKEYKLFKNRKELEEISYSQKVKNIKL